MFRELTIKEWEEEFLPIKNTIYNEEIDYFEPYSSEWDFIRKQDPHHVWTVVDTDDGLVINEGYHLCNRVMHFITKNPWTKGTQYQIDYEGDN
ncbi:MAG: hypothetical protein U9O94_06175 [Nanoarchaeota archaeon]|nr:hypothetical protein [Nanoarchaeota archaeon]